MAMIVPNDINTISMRVFRKAAMFGGGNLRAAFRIGTALHQTMGECIHTDFMLAKLAEFADLADILQPS